MLDLMPAPGLIFNEWDKHGTCSGPRPTAAISRRSARRALRSRFRSEYLDLSQAKTVAPAEVEEAFIRANPGRSNSAISVTCNRTRRYEVRICLSKDLQFRAADENERRTCRRDQVTMPPIRGGSKARTTLRHRGPTAIGAALGLRA